MYRLAALGLTALTVHVAACDSEDVPIASTPVTPSESATAAAVTPEATSEPTPEATEPPAKREWVPRGYAEGTYNRVVPPNAAAAIDEGDKYRSPPLPAQIEVAPAGGECVTPQTSEFRATDWIVDLARFEDEGVLLLTPTYAEEITDLLMLRAKHEESGAEHLYEARPRILHDFSQDLAPGELLRYEVAPEVPGEWVLVMTLGPNWGCITLDVPEPVTRPFAFDITAAEAAGVAFPRRDGTPERVHPSFSDPGGRGTTDRTCYAFGPGDIARDDLGARSGEWSVQGWPSAFSRWNPSSSGKLPLVPYWQDEMAPPVIRLAREGVPATTMIRQDGGWAFGGDGGPGHRFFPSAFTFPHQGTWLMVVESDPNWGCYVVDFVVGGGSSLY